MSERIDELEGRISGEASQLATLRSFVEHPGWKVQERMLEDQKNARLGECVLRPLATMDAVLGQEFMKGEISGLSLAQVAIFTTIEVLRANVEATRKLLERQNELEKEAIAGGSGSSRVDGDTYGGE